MSLEEDLIKEINKHNEKITEIRSKMINLLADNIERSLSWKNVGKYAAEIIGVWGAYYLIGNYIIKEVF